jgi:hypothetical protein
MIDIPKLVRFIGGVPFAIILIASTALFVVCGTVLESLTDSHRYAAHFTYESRLFSLLLWGFFLNILVSALRRWPFQKKHIPFLITHWGLLMILGGVIIKNGFGVQGSMNIIEGSGTDEIALANSYSLYLEDKNGRNYYPIKHPFIHHSRVKDANNDNPLEITLTNYTMNSQESLETWIKGDRLYISGIPPISVLMEKQAKATTVQLKGNTEPWELYAIDCNDIEETAKRLYVESSEIAITDRLTGELIHKYPLKDNTDVNLNFLWSPISGFRDPCMELTIAIQQAFQKYHIDLQGDTALLNKQISPLHMPRKFAIDIARPAQLIFLRDPYGDIVFFAFNHDGQIYSEQFRQSHLKSIIAYDDGFSGYTVNISLPQQFNFDRKVREDAQKHILAIQLRQDANNFSALPPPLQMLKKASEDDFAATIISYFEHWQYGGGWLFDPWTELPTKLAETLNAIDWSKEPPEAITGSSWNAIVFDSVDPLLKQGQEPESILRDLQWPSKLMDIDRHSLNPLESITWQIYSASDQLPPVPKAESSRLLSAYCRAWGIDPYLSHADADMSIESCIAILRASHRLKEGSAEAYSALMKSLGQEVSEKPFSSQQIAEIDSLFAPLSNSIIPHEDAVDIQLECPLSTSQKAVTSQRKLENNNPCIQLRLKQEGLQQLTTLTYDPFASKIKWPVLDGKYLARFQPMHQTIPYRVRLRQGRQINYPNSQQPYSYECDLVITDKERGETTEKTISMNDVHETWNGYRFYLSSVFPSDPGEIKRVQIIVNYDPVKYMLTYPGACILSLGIGLLFLQQRRKRE